MNDLQRLSARGPANAAGSARGATAAFEPWPVFDEEMVEAAANVLRSGKVNYWTGDQGRLFEEEFAAHAGCRHAVAVANGTVALELALHGLGIGPGDEVIVPSRTFIASASAVVARGARPVIVDVDPDSQTLTAETISAGLTPRTRAIVAVHLAGWPCDMDPILELAEEHKLQVIEDCAQAHGACYKGRPVGSLGQAAAFSFCQDKILSLGGEGGMVVTNNSDVWDRAWRYKDHGKRPDVFYRRTNSSVFQWVHEGFGSNFRMTEMQAAIGRIALRRLPSWSAARRRHAEQLAACCQEQPGLRTPLPPPGCQHAWYKFYTFVRPESLRKGWDRDRILEEIRARAVPCFSGSCSEIYLEGAFPADWRPSHRLPVAKILGETSLMFLVHPTLSQQSIQRTCEAIEQVMMVAMLPAATERLTRSAA